MATEKMHEAKLNAVASAIISKNFTLITHDLASLSASIHKQFNRVSSRQLSSQLICVVWHHHCQSTIYTIVLIECNTFFSHSKASHGWELKVVRTDGHKCSSLPDHCQGSPGTLPSQEAS